MPITRCSCCAKLYVEPNRDAADEPGRLCEPCFGATIAGDLSQLCAPIVQGYAQGKSGLDADMLQHLIDLGDSAERIRENDLRLRRLVAVAAALVRRLDALGFDDSSRPVSGADTVDAIAELLPSLRKAIAQ